MSATLGYHAWLVEGKLWAGHVCNGKWDVHRLPSMWSVLDDGKVIPSLDCHACGTHEYVKVEEYEPHDPTCKRCGGSGYVRRGPAGADYSYPCYPWDTTTDDLRTAALWPAMGQ